MLIAMIVAMDETGAIGDGNTIPWKLSDDMARFKQITEGHGNNAVIMGRKTWSSLPQTFRPLPDRLNIVMSRNSKWKENGSESAIYPGRAIEIAHSEACEECWIIGGSQIYELFIELVDEIHITRVHAKNSGIIKFPKWNNKDWTEEIIETKKNDVKNEFDTTYSIWKKS
ncbi:MAG: dihydrofolate reductase [Candidatus Poseidoniales archaeon]|jgi:dihydrofolate reductase|tara:strand:- start:221 stop:730 length:510 start_codon:yes stop_codon:yes gene_type:complete